MSKGLRICSKRGLSQPSHLAHPTRHQPGWPWANPRGRVSPYLSQVLFFTTWSSFLHFSHLTLYYCLFSNEPFICIYKWTKPAPRVSFQSLPHSKTVSLWEVPLDFLAVDSLIRPDQISGAAKPHAAPVILAPVPMSLFTLSFLQTKTEIQQDGEIIMTSQTVPRLCQCRITALWLLWSVPRAT